MKFPDGRDPHLTIKGWHHGFLGLVPLAAGLALILIAPLRDLRFLIPAVALVALGGWLLVDDVVQHLAQHWRPGYRSPVNRLYGKLGRAIGLFVFVLQIGCASAPMQTPAPMLITAGADNTASAGGAAPADTLFAIQVLAMFSYFANDAGFYDMPHGSIQHTDNIIRLYNELRIATAPDYVTQWPENRIVESATWWAEREQHGLWHVLAYWWEPGCPCRSTPYAVAAWNPADGTLVIK